MATLLNRGISREAVAEKRANRPDTVLIGSVVALSALGLLMIYSVTRVENIAENLPPSWSMERQMIFVVVGLIAMGIASYIDYREYRHLLPFLYSGSILLLALVFLFEPVKGARRWIDLGVFQLQPSELAKLTVIFALAAVLAPARQEAGLTWRRIGVALGVIALPAGLILFEPDLGTAMVLPFIALVMLFAAGLSWRQLVTLLLSGVAVVAMAVRMGLLEEYQMNRIRVLFNPDLDPQGIGWNLQQSRLAIGSGQLFGRGLFQGTVTNLQYVPEQETDFIFTAVGEQLGFVGGLLVIAVYLVILWRLLVIAAHARDRFGALVVVGIAGMLMFHVFVNIGMTMGIAPMTGLPLPFMSQGGTFFVTVSVAIGIANSIWLRRSPVPGETYIL